LKCLQQKKTSIIQKNSQLKKKFEEARSNLNILGKRDVDIGAPKSAFGKIGLTLLTMISVFMMISDQGMKPSAAGSKELATNQKMQNITDYSFGMNLKELNLENLSKLSAKDRMLEKHLIKEMEYFK
jgi:hypothetical protein